MATSQARMKLEARVVELETKVEKLQQSIAVAVPATQPWWEPLVGAFADDPAFEDAMRLGREYRESLRSETIKQTESV